MYVALCRWDILCRIFILYICHEYLCHIFWMRILAKYIYKYHIHNNTWKRSRKYFMLMWKGTGGQQNYVFRMRLRNDFYVNASMSVSMLCWHGDAPVRKMEKPHNYLLLHTWFMCRCQHVGKYVMPKWRHQWKKWKTHKTTCPFIHDLCADAGMLATMKCRPGDTLVVQIYMKIWSRKYAAWEIYSMLVVACQQLFHVAMETRQCK